MNLPSKYRRLLRAGSAARAVTLAGLMAGLGLTASAQVFFTENFNTDGETSNPQRYTTTGHFVSEQANHVDNGVSADQTGPVFWARNTEVSIVGVPGPTAERRAIMAWDAAIATGDVSPQFWTMFDATVNWLLRGKANATVIFAPASASAASLSERLAAKGHTIVDDDGSVPAATVVGDLIIRGPGAADSSRFGIAKIPMLTFSATDHDDLLVSTIGATATFTAGDATIVTPSHPAAGGLTGSFPVATGDHTWQLIGDILPNGAITVASFTQEVPPTAASFADVDAMVAGTKQSTSAVSQDSALDYSDNSLGFHQSDLPIPGGAVNIYGLVSKGKIAVSTAGTYSFAVGYDDGARLRIDKDANGFTDSDNVASNTGVGTAYGDVTLAAGTYDFEVTSFNSGGNGHTEVSVSRQANGGDTDINSGNWESLGAGLTSGAVSLSGATFTTTAYTPTGAPEQRVLPLLVLLNGPNDTPPGSVFGGGPFAGFEGTGYFGGAALNKYVSPDGSVAPMTLTLKPVDVTGKQNVKLTIAVAGTYLDFETSDLLDVLIDPNSSGNFTRLIHFTAPSGNDKYFDDRSTNPNNPTRLGLVFKDVTYNIPPGATQLTIQIQATTTWWNEIVAFDNIRLSAGEVTPEPPPGIAIAANLSAGGPRTTPGDGLNGEYWQRGVNTIKTDGNTVAANRVDAQIASFGKPTGTFTAKGLSYTGNDLSAVPGWLAGDSASFSGTPGNLDDGAFRFTGFINIAAAGALKIGTTSDDGSRVKIAGIDIVNNDGGHGDATVDEDVNFAAAGVYPIEITYFNGDWTSDNSADGAASGVNHSGNPDPAVHGGANFHLRINGATITAAQAGTYLFTAPTPNYVPARLSAGAPRTTPGDGLYGEYWQRGVNTIKTDGNTVAANRVDTQIASFGTPTGTFTAKGLSYTGNDLSAVPGWLAGDSASFMGTPGNLDDGAFRFSGFINIAAPGVVKIGTTSDDGSRVKIAGMDVVNNDGGHGDATVDTDVNFAAAGVYPIEITYFNGDWTSDNSADGAASGVNHSGNPDSAVHGGANFHLRINGATITPALVGTHLYTAPVPNYVHARQSAGTPLAIAGDGLHGEYWQRGVNTIKTDGNTVAANRVDAQIASFGAPSGTFNAKVLTYTGNDLSAVPGWLAGDSASFVGTPGNLDDGAFRFTGFINVAAPGPLNIGTTSDDGSRVKIAGMDVVNNDGGHGDATVDATVNFGAAGVYPIEITYFNGDWTSDNSADGAPAGVNHSGNPDSAVHGGANFHLRIGGANITADGAKMLFRTSDGVPPVPPVPPKTIAWVSFHGTDAASTAAAAAGFTTAADVGYTDLLTASGYKVNRFLTVNDADLSSLNSADLVIISRSVNSGHYQQAGETAAWNGLNKPVIVMGGYLLRASRLGFTTGDTIPDTAAATRLTVKDPGHPIFSGLALGAGNVMVNPFADIVSFAGAVQRGISVNTSALAPGGTVLAVDAAIGGDNGGMIIGEWQAGATLANTPPSTLGGHRLVFLSGSREQGFTSEGAGLYDLAPDGKQLFLNAVAYMLSPKSISINFAANEPAGTGSTVTGAAGALGTATWNNVSGATGSAMDLWGDNGGSAVMTTASVEWTSPNTWRTGAAQNSAPAGNDKNLMTGYIDSNNDPSLSVTVSDVPFAMYDVYVYILGDNLTAGRGGDYKIGDQTIRHVMSAAFTGTYTEGAGGHYIVFRGVSGSSFTLTTDPLLPATGAQRAPVAAIEIVAAQPAQEIAISSVGVTGNSINIAWEGGQGPFLVQGAAAVTGPWVDLVTTTQRSTSQLMIVPTAFFRVIGGTSKSIQQFKAVLSGAAERPAVNTPAAGLASVSLDGDVATTILSYSGLSGPPTNGHFHGPATVDQSAGVLVGFPAGTLPAATSATLIFQTTFNAAQKTALADGMTYLNIHTAANGGGEIRGQVVP